MEKKIIQIKKVIFWWGHLVQFSEKEYCDTNGKKSLTDWLQFAKYVRK